MSLPTHQVTAVQFGALADEPASTSKVFEIGAGNHKKLIHCYNVADQRWTETNESIFSLGASQRRESESED